jgi:hypothetical protein
LFSEVIMFYATATPAAQEHLRAYVESLLERFWAYRESKENFGVAALAVFLDAVATALVSKDWPPTFAQSRPGLILATFTIVWLLVAVYVRYQLRKRRWAALRVSGCEWLLAEWLPDSPRAMANKGQPPPVVTPSNLVLVADVLWPMRGSVAVLNPSMHVYPNEIEHAWLWAQDRGTDALGHEYIIHLLGWLGYLAVVLRTMLA